MIRREEVLQNYLVSNGTIVSPGRFEGQPLYVPALWELVMDGLDEPLDEFPGDERTRVFVSEALREEYPELEDDSYIMYQTDDGFILAMEDDQ